MSEKGETHVDHTELLKTTDIDHLGLVNVR
jgi:hypothetical protein